MNIHDLILFFTTLAQMLTLFINYKKKPILSEILTELSPPYIFIVSDSICNIIINSSGFMLHFLLLYDIKYVGYLVIPQYFIIIHFYITLIYAAYISKIRVKRVHVENLDTLLECNICYEGHPMETFPEYRCRCRKKSICGVCLMELMNRGKTCPWCRHPIYEVVLKIV